MLWRAQRKAQFAALRSETEPAEALLRAARERLDSLEWTDGAADAGGLQIRVLQLGEIRVVALNNCSAALARVRALAASQSSAGDYEPVVRALDDQYTQQVGRCAQLQRRFKQLRELLVEFTSVEQSLADGLADMRTACVSLCRFDDSEPIDDLEDIRQGAPHRTCSSYTFSSNCITASYVRSERELAADVGEGARTARAALGPPRRQRRRAARRESAAR